MKKTTITQGYNSPVQRMPASITPTLNTQQCPNLYRNLGIGVRGNDVTNLQNFLKSTGDFTYPSFTSYYGPATQTAVQRWQARNGVVSYGTPSSTGYGVVGLATRKAISQGCGRVGFESLEKDPVREVAENTNQFTLSSSYSVSDNNVVAIFNNVTKRVAAGICSAIKIGTQKECKWGLQSVVPLFTPGFQITHSPNNVQLNPGNTYSINITDNQRNSATYRMFVIHEDLLQRTDEIYEAQIVNTNRIGNNQVQLTWRLEGKYFSTNGVQIKKYLDKGTYQVVVVDETTGRVSNRSNYLNIAQEPNDVNKRGDLARLAANTPLMNGRWSGYHGVLMVGKNDNDTIELAAGNFDEFDIFRGTDFPEEGYKNTIVFVQENGNIVIIATAVETFRFNDITLSVAQLLEILKQNYGGILRTTPRHDRINNSLNSNI